MNTAHPLILTGYPKTLAIWPHTQSTTVQYSLKDIISVLNGTKIVYSSDTCSECDGVGDAKLFIFDAATKTLEKELKPWVGSPTTGTVIESEPGIVLGGKGNTIFKIDWLCVWCLCVVCGCVWHCMWQCVLSNKLIV